MSKGKSKGLALFVTLGFLMSVLMAMAPAAAAGRDAPNFTVTLTVKKAGTEVTEANVGDALNISANVAIAADQPNVTDLNVQLTIDGVKYLDTAVLGALEAPNTTDAFWNWTPSEPGDYNLTVMAFNDTDHANHTVVWKTLKVLGTNLTLNSVVVAPVEALIGIDDVTITANVTNSGNVDGTAHVYFKMGTVDLANKTGDVAAGASAEITYTTNFAQMGLSDGTFTVVGELSDLTTTTQTSNEFTLTNPVAVLAVTNLTAPSSGIEGASVSIVANVTNGGTGAATGEMVYFLFGADEIGNATVDLLAGQAKDLTFTWTLPTGISADQTKVLKAKVQTSELGMNFTVVKKAAKLEFGAITVPAGKRVGETVTLSAVVKNTGTAEAVNITIGFWDGLTSATSAPFSLAVDAEKTVNATMTLSGVEGNHTFTVKGDGAQKAVNQTVLRALEPASIGIVSASVKPSKMENKPKDSTQTFTITVVLKNSGEVNSTVQLLAMEGLLKPIGNFTELNVPANESVTKTFKWKVKGQGTHKATVMVIGIDVDSSAMTREVKCELKYTTPGFEVLFLAAAIVVAALLMKRRK